MQMTIKKKIGQTNYNFIVQGDNLHQVIMESKKLSFGDVPQCGHCKKNNLYLTAYVTAEDRYEYTKIVCRDCGASVTFGQPKKEPDTFYLRKNNDGSPKWEKRESKPSQSKPAGKPDIPNAPPPTDDDLPF